MLAAGTWVEYRHSYSNYTFYSGSVIGKRLSGLKLREFQLSRLSQPQHKGSSRRSLSILFIRTCGGTGAKFMNEIFPAIVVDQIVLRYR